MKGSAGMSAICTEIPVIGQIAVACVCFIFVSFSAVMTIAEGWPVESVAHCAVRVKPGGKCLIAWRFSRHPGPPDPPGLLRPLRLGLERLVELTGLQEL